MSQTVAEHPPIFPTPTSKVQPLLQLTPPPINRHPVLTCFKRGHLKQKTILDLAHTIHIPIDPTCFSLAIKDSKWGKAMFEEI